MPRFLSMIRNDENNHPAGGPSDALMEGMGKLIEEMTEAGVMLETGGLLPTSKSARVGQRGGQIAVTDGPFTETKEVVGGYMILRADDLAQAVEWSRKFIELHEPEWEIACEVREIVGA
ncbi:transcriptional regulator [Streptomyces sp. AcH 505]|uniref:YciI family protein n=1 Tax=Streptomyces sp. AcH 505 TaxID=352211 RepID=UPI000591CA13|nr:transcriptional regulator [Streptomyces sp. AcH 505]